MQSINKRIDDLENKIIEKDDLLTKIKRLESQKKEKQLESMVNTYKEYLISIIPENFSYELNIVELICLTYKYIKENETSISKVLNTKVSNELIEECLIHFVNVNVDVYTDDMIRANYNYIKETFFDPLKQESQPVKEKSSSVKKWFK